MYVLLLLLLLIAIFACALRLAFVFLQPELKTPKKKEMKTVLLNQFEFDRGKDKRSDEQNTKCDYVTFSHKLSFLIVILMIFNDSCRNYFSTN